MQEKEYPEPRRVDGGLCLAMAVLISFDYCFGLLASGITDALYIYLMEILQIFGLECIRMSFSERARYSRWVKGVLLADKIMKVQFSSSRLNRSYLESLYGSLDFNSSMRQHQGIQRCSTVSKGVVSSKHFHPLAYVRRSQTMDMDTVCFQKPHHDWVFEHTFHAPLCTSIHGFYIKPRFVDGSIIMIIIIIISFHIFKTYFPYVLSGGSIVLAALARYFT